MLQKHIFFWINDTTRFWKTSKSNWRSRKFFFDILKSLKPKELEAIKDKSDDNEQHLKYKDVFNELSNERIGEIYNISKEGNFNNSTYHFKGWNNAPVTFIKFTGPMHI